ncbi:MAG: hypothetical protein ACREM2_01510 [Vulcanimicrobiaceae bacterium]
MRDLAMFGARYFGPRGELVRAALTFPLDAVSEEVFALWWTSYERLVVAHLLGFPMIAVRGVLRLDGSFLRTITVTATVDSEPRLRRSLEAFAALEAIAAGSVRPLRTAEAFAAGANGFPRWRVAIGGNRRALPVLDALVARACAGGIVFGYHANASLIDLHRLGEGEAAVFCREYVGVGRAAEVAWLETATAEAPAAGTGSDEASRSVVVEGGYELALETGIDHPDGDFPGTDPRRGARLRAAEHFELLSWRPSAATRAALAR